MIRIGGKKMPAKNDFLDRIVARKKEEVAEAARRIPGYILRKKAEAPCERRPFHDRLRAPGASGVNIVAEIKRASPSRGVLKPDLDPAALAIAYASGGAAALSVLTDRSFFLAEAEDLPVARRAAPIPVLRKDFIVSAYQIYESAVMGADAILLIARILTEGELGEFVDLSRSIGIDPLVEIHSEPDFEKATRGRAGLIAINNRNLSSFETDLDVSIRLASFLAPGQTAVAASGIGSRKDIERLREAGIFNFLVGESLMRAACPGDFLRHLRGG
jgi:indole-3-glycerol phosphate synthase